jgi:hypothetical protein
VVVIDAFAGYREALPGLGTADEELFGGRIELLLKF